MANDTGGTNRPSFLTSNMMTRTITALVLVPLILFGAYRGGVLWLAMMSVVGAVGILEFYMLAGDRPERGNIPVGLLGLLAILAAFHLDRPLLAVGIFGLCFGLAMMAEMWPSSKKTPVRVPLHVALMTVGGLFYVALPVAFLLSLSRFESGFVWLLVVFLLTWGTDTFAYFGGRAFGRHKLAPRLSPSKTIEGAVIGAVGGFALSTGWLLYNDLHSTAALLMCGIAPLAAILGDLFESGLKRHFNVKDSHVPGLNIIPGHGGVLDRIDALIFVTLFCYTFIVLSGIVV